MSGKCQVCGKGPLFGKNVSHSHKKTLKVQRANVQTINVVEGKRTKKASVCTKCIKANKVTKA
ncbi:MAG: 50S ribosomal protein L28 [Actinomycetota bacterium]|nr:50S ribosomal protein L28 [Actinomycetota bacterium]